jgi:hypothetical protein
MSEAANADQQGRRDAKVILITFRHAQRFSPSHLDHS